MGASADFEDADDLGREVGGLLPVALSDALHEEVQHRFALPALIVQAGLPGIHGVLRQVAADDAARDGSARTRADDAARNGSARPRTDNAARNGSTLADTE